jgi:hypothetical protein
MSAIGGTRYHKDVSYETNPGPQDVSYERNKGLRDVS